jgi:hypothetical protein
MMRISTMFIVTGLLLTVLPTPVWITPQTAIRVLTAAVYIVGGFLLFRLEQILKRLGESE